MQDNRERDTGETLDELTRRVQEASARLSALTDTHSTRCAPLAPLTVEVPGDRELRFHRGACGGRFRRAWHARIHSRADRRRDSKLSKLLKPLGRRVATKSARANAIAAVRTRYDRVTVDPDLEFYGFERVRDPDLDFYGFTLPTKRRRVKRAEQRRRVRARSRALRDGILCDDEHLDFYGFSVTPDPDLDFYG